MSLPTVAAAVRPLRPADIEAGLQLCRASGWNQTRRDWEQFLNLSPHGCRIAVMNERVVGTVATVNYEQRFGWVAMVLVEPAARGQGIGMSLMQAALTILSDARAIRLDATPAGQPVYRQLGFVDEYSLSRMETVVARAGLKLPDNPARRLTGADLPAVFRFDRAAFGADRRALLEWMFAGAPEYAWVIEQHGQINGYCFGRHGHNAAHLGPVIAHDQATARQLVTACLAEQSGRAVYLDALHHAPDWRAWLESVGFREQRPFLRMSRGENAFPGWPEKQFAILGPEFG